MTTVREIHTKLTAAKAVLESLKSVYGHLSNPFLFLTLCYSTIPTWRIEVALDVHKFFYLLTFIITITIHSFDYYIFIHFKDGHKVASLKGSDTFHGHSLSGNLQQYHYAIKKTAGPTH